MLPKSDCAAGSQRVFCMIGKERLQDLLGKPVMRIPLALDRPASRLDVDSRKFVVDGLREAARQAGIGSHFLQIVRRAGIIPFRLQAIEDFFLRIGRKRRAERIGQLTTRPR